MKITMILLASSLSFLAMAEPHTWMFQNGDKFSGEYYSSGQEKAVVTIKISDLSEADKKYVAEQKAAQLQAAKQQAAKIRPVRIVSILDGFGQCEVTGIAPVSTKIIILDIPESVKAYLADYYQLLNDSTDGKYTEEQLTVAHTESQLARTDVSAGNGAVDVSVGSTVGSGTTLNKTYNVRLPEVKAHLAENTTILAYQLSYSHDGFNVWQCVGVVPP